MKLFIKFLKLVLIGGLIGFSINYTWSFQENAITFIYAGIVYFVAGYIQQHNEVKLTSIENLFLFWYMFSLIIFAAIVNYTWDLPILISTCILTFTSGHFAGYYRSKKSVAETEN